MTNNDRTATTITDEQARELYSLRLDKAWSWYELAQRYGIDERDARRVYDRIHAQRIAEANGTATTDETTTDDYSFMNTAAWIVACDCCLIGTGCVTDRFAFNYWMRADVDAALTENVRDAREMVAGCIDRADEFRIEGEELDALADELRMIDEWLDDHAGRIGLAREIVAFANDVDPYAITTNIDDLDRAAADLARDLTQCVPWLEDQVTEYDDQEARELLDRVRAALDEDLGEWMALAYDAGEQMGIETWANYRDAIGC